MVSLAGSLLGFATLAAGAAIHIIMKQLTQSGNEKHSPDQVGQAMADNSMSTSSEPTVSSTPVNSQHILSAESSGAAIAEPETMRLQEAYASMAAAFARKGLDLSAIAETSAWFETGPAVPWPRRYANFVPRPLAPASVRLVIVPLAANCPKLASTVSAMARELLALLPPGYKVYSNAQQNLHITVFHFSHPIDTRQDTLDPHSGLAALYPSAAAASQQDDAALAEQQQQTAKQQGSNSKPGHQHQQQQVYSVTAGSQYPTAAAAAELPAQLDPALLPPPSERPGITGEQLAAEQAAAAAVVAATPSFTLQLERVLIARSGVLLVTWTDPSGAVARLRQALQHTFPGACSKQSSIIHTTVFRIVETPAAAAAATESANAGGTQQQQQHCEAGQLSAAAIASINSCCMRWTDKLRSTQLAVSQLWWVSEEEFSTVEGNRVPLACNKQ